MQVPDNNKSPNDNGRPDFPESQYGPTLLTVAEIGDPSMVFRHFVSIRSLPGQKELLWEMLSAALAGQGAGMVDGQEAGEWVFLWRELERLMEAVYVQHG